MSSDDGYNSDDDDADADDGADDCDGTFSDVMVMMMRCCCNYW